MGCGVSVGITGVFPSIGGKVGVAALGGMKGVGIGVGEQAGDKSKTKRMANRYGPGLKRFRVFICPRKNVGATPCARKGSESPLC